MCLVLCGFSLQAQARPTQDEVDAAKRVQALAEAEQGTAEANKARIEAEAAAARAKLGTLDISKLSMPDAEAKTLGIEGKLLAYAAVQNLSEKIVGAISTIGTNKPVVIMSEKELISFDKANSFLSNAAMLDVDIKQELNISIPVVDSKCTLDEEAAGSSLGPLGSIDVATQILSIFKTSKAMEGTDVSIDEFALSAALATELKRKKIVVIYPSLFFSGSLLGTRQTSDIEQALSNVSDNIPLIEARLPIIASSKSNLEKHVEADKNPSPACMEAYDSVKKQLQEMDKRAQILKARAEKYLAAAGTVDEATGETLVQALVAAEALRKTASDGWVLHIKPIAAGGTTLTKKNFFFSSFRFTGGAVVAYMLVDGTDGKLLHSGLVGDYGGYVKPDQLPDVIRTVNRHQTPPIPAANPEPHLAITTQ